MQNDKIYSNAFSSIYTKEDLDGLLTKLEEEKRKLYKNISMTSFDMENDEKMIQTQIDKAKEFKLLDLKIAFQPDQKFIEKLFFWVRQNCPENVILNFSYEPMVLGGAEISFNGKYIDLTLRKILDGF